MRFFSAQGFLATTLGVLALSACGGRPDLATDLRPEGPPDLLAVMLPIGQFTANNGVPVEIEVATYCKANDDKAPTIIGLPDQSVLQICPEAADDPPITTVMDANPNGLKIRIVFDELLDPAIETLTDSADGGPCTSASDTCDGHINTTLPVTLSCNNTPVPFDGYYVPNGNNISWPPGPALVVVPDGFVATSAACTIAVRDNVLDKQGEVVPADQRGPFNFSVGAMVIDGSDPADGDEIAPDAAVVVTFNVEVADASVQAADIVVHDDTANVNVPVDITVSGTDIEILPTSGTWTDGSSYTVTIPDTATITDIGGGPYVPDGDFVITFTVAA